MIFWLFILTNLFTVSFLLYIFMCKYVWLHQLAFSANVYCNMMSECQLSLCHTDIITACNDGSMLNVWRSLCPVRHYSVFYNQTPAGGGYVTRRTRRPNECAPTSPEREEGGREREVRWEMRQEERWGEVTGKTTRGEQREDRSGKFGEEVAEEKRGEMWGRNERRGGGSLNSDSTVRQSTRRRRKLRRRKCW